MKVSVVQIETSFSRSSFGRMPETEIRCRLLPTERQLEDLQGWQGSHVWDLFLPGEVLGHASELEFAYGLFALDVTEGRVEALEGARRMWHELEEIGQEAYHARARALMALMRAEARGG